jgi:hypothetical protein
LVELCMNIKRLGRTYELRETKAPSSEQISLAVHALADRGLRVKIGG